MTDVAVERFPVKQLRRWCPVAETHQDIDDEWCGWNDCREMATHKLRLRRMFICSVDYCKQGYFTRAEFDRHECGSAY